MWRAPVEMDEFPSDNGFKQKCSRAWEHLERHKEDKLDMKQQHLCIVKGFAFLGLGFIQLNSHFVLLWLGFVENMNEI